MTPSELRRWVVRMMRAGRGEQVEPETSEPPISTRDETREPRKTAATRRKPGPKSPKQSGTD